MGQRPSGLVGGRFPSKSHRQLFPWLVRRQETTLNPEQPIKFQYKTRRKLENTKNNSSSNNTNIAGAASSVNHLSTINNLNKSNQSNFNSSNISSSNNNNSKLKNTNVNDVSQCRVNKAQIAPARTKSEPNLGPREKHRHRRRSAKAKNGWDATVQQFGYEIQDVDAFLAKATIEKPANIPVVLAFPSVLYQTRIGGYQAEIALPLGMVVNAVFKNQHWLYVQTPHAEEGYVSYAACLPLGIIPPPDEAISTPCWENSTDVFPKPSGNMTDTEKLSSKSECGRESRCYSRRSALSTCGERSVDRLYLRAAKTKKNRAQIRQTLLVIAADYAGKEKNALSVAKGDVVVLLGTHVPGWFWARSKDGAEGFIPAAIAGHGFL